jgi:hypothetical protein
MAEIHQDALSVFQDDLTGIPVSDGVENYLMSHCCSSFGWFESPFCGFLAINLQPFLTEGYPAWPLANAEFA